MSHAYPPVRLSNQDLVALANTFQKHFLAEDHLWIFGSRINLQRKGGDLDLYIETNAATIDAAITMQTNFIWDLEHQIGEQKIDVVLNILNLSKTLPIYQVAKTEGVRII